MSEEQRNASFVGATAVAHAEKYLAGRSTPELLLTAADQLMERVFLLPSAGAERISDATRLLVITMVRTAKARCERELRWRDVLRSICELVRHEARAVAERRQS